MADLRQMSRILYHHDWVDVEDWAHSINRLADLTDDEICQLEWCCNRDFTAHDAATNDDSGNGSVVRAPVTARQCLQQLPRMCLQGLMSICASMRLPPLRRTC
jgi:hypothetical protein